MGLTDSLKGAMSQASKKATEYAGSHKSQIGAGLDKVGDLADKATKGKYKSQIDMGRDKAKEAVNKMGDPARTIQGEATAQGGATEKAEDQRPDAGAGDGDGDQDATK